MARNKRVTSKVILEKPERFTDAEWGALTPMQKVRYSANSGLWKRGETSGKRGVREPKKQELKRDRRSLPRIPMSGPDAPLPVVVGGQGGTPANAEPGEPGGQVTTQQPAFEVLESDDPGEVAEVNGARLMVDAFKRAARMPQKVDPFDMHVYLALVQKMPSLGVKGKDRDESPAESKRNVRLLSQLLAEEGQFREVSGDVG